jgi:hypothetical protein
METGTASSAVRPSRGVDLARTGRTNAREADRFPAYAAAMGKELDPARHASRYTDSEIELGLRAMAIASGNARKASTLLRRQGIKIPRTTLQVWATDLHVDRYRRIQREEMPAIYDRIAERSERIVDDLGELEAQLVEQMREQAPDLSPRDTASTLRNVTVAKAVNIDKASVIRGRPTEITGNLDVNELLRQFKQRWGDVIMSEPVEAQALEESPDTRAKGDPAGPDEGAGRDLSA